MFRFDALWARAAVLGAFSSVLTGSAAIAQSKQTGEMFDPAAVVRGIEVSREACSALEKQDTAVWVEAGGRGACMRYYAAGLRPAPDPNPVAALWMNGDVLGATGNNADKHQKGFGTAFMVRQESTLAARYGVPSIYLGRPGTYGSSGRHFTMRGRPIEASLVSAALDALKERYGIRSWSLGGHSGGGTLVAEMLARRDDVRCAVISSGAAAYHAWLESHGLAYGERLTRFDPSASLGRVPVDPNRRVFVIGDPRDAVVPFATQQSYFDGLAARGHVARLVPLERANGRMHHDLMDFGEAAMEMCAAGDDTAQILDVLRSMPEERRRITN